MKCEEALLRQRTGDPALDSDLAAHLESCASCRAERQADETLLDELRALPRPDPGPDHARRFRRGVRERLETGGLMVARHRWPAMPLLAAAALIVLMAGLGAVFIWMGPSSTEVALGTEGLPAVSDDLYSLGLEEVEDLSPVLGTDVGEDLGSQVWAAAVTGEAAWIEEMSDEDQIALLQALQKELG